MLLTLTVPDALAVQVRSARRWLPVLGWLLLAQAACAAIAVFLLRFQLSFTEEGWQESSAGWEGVAALGAMAGGYVLAFPVYRRFVRGHVDAGREWATIGIRHLLRAGIVLAILLFLQELGVSFYGARCDTLFNLQGHPCGWFRMNPFSAWSAAFFLAYCLAFLSAARRTKG